MKKHAIFTLSALSALSCATDISGPEDGGEMVIDGAGATDGAGTGGAIMGSGGYVDGAGATVGVGATDGVGATVGAGATDGVGATVGAGATDGAGGAPIVTTGGAPGAGGTIVVSSGGAPPGAGGAPVGPAVCSSVGWSSSNGYGDNGSMCGYAWTAINGQGETITPPCGASTCFVGAEMCASGTIPAENAAGNIYPGVMIGWNVSQAAAGGAAAAWTSTGSGLTATFRKGGAAGQARVVVQVGTPGNTVDYCANATSGVAIPWTSFTIGCWTPGGTPLTVGASVVAVALQINSTGSLQTFTDFCLDGITLN